MTHRRRHFALAPLTLVAAAIIVAGCTIGGAPAATPTMSLSGAPSAPSEPGPTAVPGGPAESPSGSDNGAAPVPSGPDDPVTGGPGAGGPGFPDPDQPQPTIVAPGVGLTGIHPVGATKLETATNGRDLAVRVDWYSGVEPCSVLAGVDVARDGNTFKLTVNEGSAAAPDTACIDIAMYKGTIVDLGELEPGTYTVTAFGDAPPVTVTID